MKDALQQELQKGDIIAVLGGYGADVFLIESMTPTGRARVIQPYPVYDEDDETLIEWGFFKQTTSQKEHIIKISEEQVLAILAENDENDANLIAERIIEMYRERTNK